LLLAILTGVTLILLGEQGKKIGSVIDGASHLFFRILGLFIRLAPIGVFGAVAFTTSSFGFESLQKIALLLGTFFVSCIIFISVIFAILMRLCGFSLWRLIKYLRDELTIVAATTSSDAVLPQTMVKLEGLGVQKSTVGLVFPTGYSFNLDGFSIYLTLAVLFIAQATDTDLTVTQTVSILLVALLTSKGAHGVPGSAIVILAATLSSVPALPLSGLMLLLPADWFVGIARALTNYLGNCVGTIVMGKITKTIDSDQVKAKLLAGPDEITPIGADAKST
jgi:aerobic C4-dicarboxylate transport protein